MIGKTYKILSISILILYIATVGFLCFGKFDSDFINQQSNFWGLDDKDIHFLMLSPFVFLTYLAFFNKKKEYIKFYIFLIGMLIVAAGATLGIEYLQGLTLHRGRDINDAYAGILGAATGAIFTIIIHYIRSYKK